MCTVCRFFHRDSYPVLVITKQQLNQEPKQLLLPIAFHTHCTRFLGGEGKRNEEATSLRELINAYTVARFRSWPDSRKSRVCGENPGNRKKRLSSPAGETKGRRLFSRCNAILAAEARTARTKSKESGRARRGAGRKHFPLSNVPPTIRFARIRDR